MEGLLKFLIDDIIQPGRTSLNYPKGIVATYKVDNNLIYDYIKCYIFI